MSDGNEFQTSDAATAGQLLTGMIARAVGVTMLTEVGDDWADRRHEPADSGMMARDHIVAHDSWYCATSHIIVFHGRM